MKFKFLNKNHFLSLKCLQIYHLLPAAIILQGIIKIFRWALKSRGSWNVPSEQNAHLSMYGYDIWCGISKGTFEIPHQISYPYIERYDINTTSTFQELLALRGHMCFWNVVQVPMCQIPPRPNNLMSKSIKPTRRFLSLYTLKDSIMPFKHARDQIQQKHLQWFRVHFTLNNVTFILQIFSLRVIYCGFTRNCLHTHDALFPWKLLLNYSFPEWRCQVDSMHRD